MDEYIWKLESSLKDRGRTEVSSWFELSHTADDDDSLNILDLPRPSRSTKTPYPWFPPTFFESDHTEEEIVMLVDQYCDASKKLRNETFRRLRIETLVDAKLCEFVCTACSQISYAKAETFTIENVFQHANDFHHDEVDPYVC